MFCFADDDTPQHGIIGRKAKMGYVPVSNEQHQVVAVNQLGLVDVPENPLDLR